MFWFREAFCFLVCGGDADAEENGGKEDEEVKQ